MPFYFSWGTTFLAIRGEFWPSQIAQIRMRAEELFERRPQDGDLERAAQIRASIIPFEMYGYGFALMLSGDVWTLEVVTFPPHAEPGQRIRKARRDREKNERKTAAEKTDEGLRGERWGNEGLARAISTVMNASSSFLSNLYNISRAACAKLKRLRRKLASFLEHIELATQVSPWTAGEEILRWLSPSSEVCRAANIAAWVQHRLPHGFQRERRLFFADFLPIWLDTIGPIETIFVRGGQSIFGELFPEREFAS